MNVIRRAQDRRQFLCRTGALACGALLSGCGPFDEIAPPADTRHATAVAPGTSLPVTTAGTQRLNLALNLAYIGAQFYGQASGGVGLPTDQTVGVGRAGAAFGARLAKLSDPMLTRYAAEFAADKAVHVATLRGLLSESVAAQPLIDLSPAPTSAFSLAAQAARIVSPGTAFDPYSGDNDFLLGAFLIEDPVAAAYRALLDDREDTDAAMAAMLADAIYHGGLIRALIARRGAADPAMADALTTARSLCAPTDLIDFAMLTSAGGDSDLIEEAGQSIPFTRTGGTVLRAVYLSPDTSGGFLPAGANGLSV